MTLTHIDGRFWLDSGFIPGLIPCLFRVDYVLIKLRLRIYSTLTSHFREKSSDTTSSNLTGELMNVLDQDKTQHPQNYSCDSLQGNAENSSWLYK